MPVLQLLFEILISTVVNRESTFFKNLGHDHMLQSRDHMR